MFLMDGQKAGKTINRLNLIHDTKNWLSMKTTGQVVSEVVGAFVNFGEHDDNNELHGRGIR